MLNDNDIPALLRMACESEELERAWRERGRRRAVVALAAAIALAASAGLWLARSLAPSPVAPAASATPEAVGEPVAAPGEEEGRVVLAVFGDGAGPPCVVRRDFRGLRGHALPLLTRADLAELADPCKAGPRRVLLIELAGPARLLPLTPQDARVLVDCLGLAEERLGDLGCAAATRRRAWA